MGKTRCRNDEQPLPLGRVDKKHNPEDNYDTVMGHKHASRINRERQYTSHIERCGMEARVTLVLLVEHCNIRQTNSVN